MKCRINDFPSPEQLYDFARETRDDIKRKCADLEDYGELVLRNACVDYRLNCREETDGIDHQVEREREELWAFCEYRIFLIEQLWNTFSLERQQHDPMFEFIGMIGDEQRKADGNLKFLTQRMNEYYDRFKETYSK